LSVSKRREAKKENAILEGLGGALVGGIVLGPVGALAGAVVGARHGYKKNPDR
jgi:hypothetical protein